MRFGLILTALLASTASALGGQSEMHPITGRHDLEVKFGTYFKIAVIQKANRYFKTFKPISYSYQIVAGTNYEIIYEIEDGRKMKVRIFEPLPYTNDLPEVQNIEYIEAPKQEPVEVVDPSEVKAVEEEQAIQQEQSNETFL